MIVVQQQFKGQMQEHGRGNIPMRGRIHGFHRQGPLRTPGVISA